MSSFFSSSVMVKRTLHTPAKNLIAEVHSHIRTRGGFRSDFAHIWGLGFDSAIPRRCAKCRCPLQFFSSSETRT
jgi:hypothetical protein